MGSRAHILLRKVTDIEDPIHSVGRVVGANLNTIDVILGDGLPVIDRWVEGPHRRVAVPRGM